MKSRPNILVILMDSVRPDWLGCYGQSEEVSPHLDAVAHEGYLFQKTISPSSWTFPVMASVFTGMNPAKHGGHDEHLQLDSAYPTMAEIFARHGYDTAAYADVPFVGPMTGLHRGFNTMSNLEGSQVTLKSKLYKGIKRVHSTISGGYRKTLETPVLIGEAMHWLKQGWDRRKPFFLYIHSDEPHAPFLPPAAYRRRFAGLSARQMHGINQDKQLFVGGAVRMTEEDFCNLKKLALAEVAYLDAWLGRLMSMLRGQRLFDDTIIVITADHGDNIGEHGLMRHAMCLYDTLLHVPLVIRPAGGMPGQRVSHMVQLIDILPTLMALAGVDDAQSAAEFQGKNLWQRVAQSDYPQYVISELYRPANMGMWARKVPQFMDMYRDKYDRAFRSVRTESHKYIWASRGPQELYDLVNDPGETHNLIEAQHQMVERLREHLAAWLASFTPADGVQTTSVLDSDGKSDTDAQIMERLRDLGYIA